MSRISLMCFLLPLALISEHSLVREKTPSGKMTWERFGVVSHSLHGVSATNQISNQKIWDSFDLTSEFPIMDADHEIQLYNATHSDDIICFVDLDYLCAVILRKDQLSPSSGIVDIVVVDYLTGDYFHQ